MRPSSLPSSLRYAAASCFDAARSAEWEIRRLRRLHRFHFPHLRKSAKSADKTSRPPASDFRHRQASCAAPRAPLPQRRRRGIFVESQAKKTKSLTCLRHPLPSAGRETKPRRSGIFFDHSPAFQGWDSSRTNIKVPSGTKDPFCRPSRDSHICRTIYPAINGWAIVGRCRS